MQHKTTSVQHMKNRQHAGGQAATKGRGVSAEKHSWNAKARRVSGIIPIPSCGERKDERTGVGEADSEPHGSED